MTFKSERETKYAWKYAMSLKVELLSTLKWTDNQIVLMGEGFILLTGGYGFMGGCTTPF